MEKSPEITVDVVSSTDNGTSRVQTRSKEDMNIADRFYPDWKSLFPQLSILFDNIDSIQNELSNIPTWVPWPEDHFALSGSNTRDWTVFPFLYTFPATDSNKSQWISSTTAICPKTTALLHQVTDIRTALFSKLGPGTELSMHTGWADLSNYVLRCHIPIVIPESGECGVTVESETTLHRPDDILIFDDSKRHCAYNFSRYEERVVLIVDILRPSHLPLGTATGSHTDELDSFVSLFK